MWLPPESLYGTRNIHYQIDSSDVVVESDEGNNWGSSTVNVFLRPDLEVIDLEVDPAVQQPGGSVTLRYTVTSHYSRTTSPVVLRFFESADSAISSGDTNLLQDVTLDSMLAGVTVVDSVVVTLPPGNPLGSRYLGAIIDADDAVTEQYETNNSRAVGYDASAVVATEPLTPTSFVFRPAFPNPFTSSTPRRVREPTVHHGRASTSTAAESPPEFTSQSWTRSPTHPLDACCS